MVVTAPGADGGGRPPLRQALVTTYGTTVLVAVLSLVNVLVMSRALGPTGRGDVVFVMAVAGLTGYVATLSVQEANANLAGLEPHRRRSLATNSLLLSVVLGGAAAACVLALGLLAPGVRGDVDVDVLWLALPAIPVIVLQNYLIFLARADYAFGIANLALLLPAVANPVLNGALAVTGQISVLTATLTWVGTQALAAVVLAGFVGRRLAGFGRPDPQLARRAVGFGLKTHVGGMMTAGNFRLDQWLLGALAGSRELGLYSVAVAWAEALFFLPTALALVLRPGLVRATPGAAREQAAAATRIALLLTLPVALAMVVAAPLLCTTIFGVEFRDSVAQLRLLVPGALGIVVLKILGNALVAQGRPLLETAGIGVAFVVTVALDLVLIPSHGGVGAAIASSAAYTAAGVATGAIFHRAFAGSAADLVPRVRDLHVARSQLQLLLRGR